MNANNINIEELIETFLKTLVSDVWIDDENKAALRQFLYFCINSYKTKEVIPYNVLIESFDDKKGVLLAKKMADIAIKILGCKGIECTEAEINKYVFEHEEKQSIIAVVTNMLPQAPENWDEILEKHQVNNKIIKLYVKSGDDNARLEKDPYFRWRFLNLHIKKTKMTPGDALECTLLGLRKKGYDFDMEFSDGFKDYIETTYRNPNSKYKEEEFVTDAILAVEQRIKSIGIDTKVLRAPAIPLYSKKREYKMNDSIKGFEDYINDYYLLPNRDVNSFLGNKKANKQDETRVLVFALSTYPFSCNQNSLNFEAVKKEENAEEYKYFYQLEPVLLKLKKELEDGQLDYVITAVTDKTITADGAKQFSGEKGCYSISMSPLELISEIVSQSGLLNNNEEKAKFLNEQIANYITPKGFKSERKRLRVIPVSVEDIENMDLSISNILNILKTIKKVENKKLIIEYDNHGGNRDAQMILESIMSLIENDKDVKIKKYTIEGGQNQFTLRDADFGPLKFVSGITEFRKYGKTQTLREYYPKSQISDSENKFVESLEHIAIGIQFNDQQIFSNGLQDIKRIDVDKLPEGSYLKLFGNEILDDYAFVHTEDKLKYTTGMIEWCADKGYFQQCLSIIESVIPAVLARCGIFSNELNSDDKLRHVADKPGRGKRQNEEINTYVFNNIFMNYNYRNAFVSLKKRNSRESVSIASIINHCQNDRQIYDFKKNDNFAKNFKIDTANKKCSDFLELHQDLKNLRNNSNHPHAVEGDTDKYANDINDINKIKEYIRIYIEEISQLPQNALKIIYDQNN